MTATFPFDLERLNNYLSAHLDGFTDIVAVEKFSGGQSNPTYKLTTETAVYVLRSQPLGQLLKSAHAVDREYRVLGALKHTQVPVAEVYHLCTDRTIIGAMFYIMQYCDGRIYWSSALPEIDSNASRSAMYDAMNQALVNLHSVDIAECGLSDYGKAGNYFERQLTRWTGQYRASELDKIIEMDELINWLASHQPTDDGKVCLVHGDFRLDNMIFAKDRPEIIAILDWELSTLGHPYADLAYQCMQLRMPPGMGSIDGLQGVDRASLGIPSEAEYVARYCQRMGIDNIDNWSFYLAFSFFRLAAIAQGVAKRAAQGNASNQQASKVGAFVKPLAQMALATIAE